MYKFLLFPLFFLPLFTFAQNPDSSQWLLWQEDLMKNNVNRWSHRYNKKDIQIYNNFGIDYKEDYKIEVALHAPDKGWEFYFGGQRNQKVQYRFRLKKGRIRISKKFGIFRWLYRSKRLPKHLPFNSHQSIRLEQIGRLWHVYVNEHKIARLLRKRTRGSEIGVRVYEEDAKIKRFAYYQKHPELYEKNMPERLAINLGENINTPYIDKAPMISPDGKKLYYLIEDHPDGEGAQDIFCSVKRRKRRRPKKNQSTYLWKLSQLQDTVLNNEESNFVCAVLADNKTILINESYGSDDDEEVLATSTMRKGLWTKPRLIRVKDWKNYSDWAAYHLSVDGMTLVFSACRKDGYGGRDLYVSRREKNGDFGIPTSLGPIVNTSANEHSPFLAADNRTLYFDSDGHPGYGGRDVYVSRRVGDGWNKWTKPKNLGPSINSRGNDEGLVLSSNGEEAFIVLDKNTYGAQDIFEVKIPKAHRPTPTLSVQGQLLDCLNKKALYCELIVQEKSNGKIFWKSENDYYSGKFSLSLPPNDYVLYVKNIYGMKEYKDSFALNMKNIQEYTLQDYGRICMVEDTNTTTEIDSNDIATIPTNVDNPSTVSINPNTPKDSLEETTTNQTMPSIHFAFDQHTISPQAKDSLALILSKAKQYPNSRIQITGHTDSRGSVAYNQQLSKRRAQSAADYLVQQGITKERLQIEFKGEEQANREPEKRHAYHRRVDFKLIFGRE